AGLSRPGRATDEISYPRPMKSGAIMPSGLSRTVTEYCAGAAKAERAASAPAARTLLARKSRRFISSPGGVIAADKTRAHRDFTIIFLLRVVARAPPEALVERLTKWS